ncbi:Geranylgeranyl diphosphate reductase [Desulfovibrio sp. DV]|uniref:geranylgeranyl reductase family protein n=1 Tax=Desulfovibrio sp. DV TaxID=1844708 RepID=UPI00094B9B65|nr:NAD(P)/FAD-dependent oxidoreductase [Desulfovibrio sp. DV]OLN25238.1 Geranylgeranyl diphosphate reductase [Desulfovibrio sp. DV]
MIETHDVIIVGAGPAGSTAAHVLARKGVRVLVLDKAEFPRDKLCAGLLTWKAVDVLERVYGETADGLLASGVFNAAQPGYAIRFRDRIIASGETFYPFHFTSRRVFDKHLLDQAVRAGADVRLGQHVAFVDPLAGVVRLDDGQEFRGRYVIGCDGAASLVRRACPFDSAAWKAGMGGALEFSLSRTDPLLAGAVHADLAAAHPTVYAGFLRAGYGWVFPHADRLIIGIGGHSARHGREFRAKLREFVTFLGLPASLADAAKGHGLPYGNYIKTPWHGRTLLAGDAAGLVETLFGEGIYYALRSGELAGEAVCAALTRNADPALVYGQGLNRDILPELIWSHRLRRVLYASQSWGFLPLLCFVRCGGRLFGEMVHGLRSYRLLLPRAKGPALHP